tara:strand:+ start:9845 stop:10729 length:885 start_codon:yes stop_codon:yes gene_type:complete
MKYLITGATGTIGQQFISTLNPEIDSVYALINSSTNLPKWCHQLQHFDDLDNDTDIDVVINLAGLSIDRYWSEENKQKIKNSRIKTTQSLVEKIKALTTCPSMMISASGIGFYDAKPEDPNIENGPVVHSFTSELCSEWEEAAQAVSDLPIKLVITRLAVVLNNSAGMIKKLIIPYKLGLGGPVGSGKQILPWIHIDDVVSGYHFIIKKNISGIYDFVAPEKTSQYEFSQIMGRVLNRPAFIPLPEFVIKTIFGEMGEELLLKGQYHPPEALIDHGYSFHHPDLHSALDNLLTK